MTLQSLRLNIIESGMLCGEMDIKSQILHPINAHKENLVSFILILEKLFILIVLSFDVLYF